MEFLLKENKMKSLRKQERRKDNLRCIEYKIFSDVKTNNLFYQPSTRHNNFMIKVYFQFSTLQLVKDNILGCTFS